MRLRNTLAAAAGALVLVLTIPASANAAALGHFDYEYKDALGITQFGSLDNPPTDRCIDLPELLSNGTPADSPRNRTNNFALIYIGAGCTGNDFPVPSNGSGSANLKLRSVMFAA